MATHKSAEKRHRQNIKRRASNRLAKSTFRTAIKSALQHAEAGEAEQAKSQANLAMKLIDKAAIHGVLHKNNAQRRISRLQKRVGSLLSK